MPTALTHRRALVPRNLRPGGGSSPIPWGDAVFAAVLGGQFQQDLTTRRRGTLLSGASWHGRNALGAGMETVSTSTDGVYFPSSARLRGITRDCTIIWIGEVRTVTAYSSLVVVPYRESAWSNPYHSLGLQRDDTNDGLRFGYASDSSNNVGVSSDTIGFSSLAGDGKVHMWGARRQGATVRFYRDGEPAGADKTLWANNAVDWANARPVCIGTHSDSSPGEGLGAVASLALIFDRGLTDDEMRAIWRDPWHSVQSARRVHGEPVVPPAGFPLTVDAFPNPSASSTLHSVSHSAQHTSANEAITAIEKFLLGRDTNDATVAVAAGRWPLTPIVPPPAEEAFTWVNKGVDADEALTALSYSGFSMRRDGESSGVSALVRVLPGNDYTVTALISPHVLPRSSPGVGICWRDSGSDKLVLFGLFGDDSDGLGLALKKYSDETTPDSDYIWEKFPASPYLVLRLQKVGTDRIASFSFDGHTFIEYHSVSNADFMTPDQIGFFVEPDQSTSPYFDVAASLLSWEEIDDGP